MGLSKERFVEEIDEFVCVICDEVFVDALTCPCEAQHVFCRECITSWLTSHGSTCPSCRQEVQSRDMKPPMIAFRNIMKRLKVKCSLSGCSEVVSLEALPSHELNCPFAFKQCPKCDTKVRISEEAQHDCVPILLSKLSLLTEEKSAVETQRDALLVENKSLQETIQSLKAQISKGLGGGASSSLSPLERWTPGLVSVNGKAHCSDNKITWNGQGSVTSSFKFLWPSGLGRAKTYQWTVRVVAAPSHVRWVCFGINNRDNITGDGDWSLSYSFCTCCDGYPKGSPRWTGNARGTVQTGDVFRCVLNFGSEQMRITGPRGVDMTRSVQRASAYGLYFTVSADPGSVSLAVEDCLLS